MPCYGCPDDPIVNVPNTAEFEVTYTPQTLVTGRYIRGRYTHRDYGHRNSDEVFTMLARDVAAHKPSTDLTISSEDRLQLEEWLAS